MVYKIEVIIGRRKAVLQDTFLSKDTARSVAATLEENGAKSATVVDEEEVTPVV